MEKIFKYELPHNGHTITIPHEVHEFLDVQAQDGVPTLWAIVDPERQAEKPIEIIAIGTGWELPSGVDKYLGTAQDGSGFVWHYFVLNLQEMMTCNVDYEKTFAALAQALGTIGVSVEEAGTALGGLFDACM